MSKVTQKTVQVRSFPPSVYHQPIVVLQSPHSRALNVGFLTKRNGVVKFTAMPLSDFGNNYYGPVLAHQLYESQLAEHQIKPRFPTAKEVLKLYHPEEVLIR